jgi:uncharacterized protein
MVPVDRSDVLKSIIAELPGAVVAYSGGADSAFLADVAHQVLGSRMTAVTAVSESLAPDERKQAADLARARGWRHEEIHTREIERHEYRRNDPDRCFHCKDVLFETLDALALDREAVVLVGTNVDDTGDFRPGLRAAREHGVRAPMVEAGLHKDEIRELSRARGLPTPERLDRVARAEAFVRALGLRQLRVRDHGDLARIEVPLENVEQLAEPMVRAQIVEHLRGLGFAHVTLDLEGFRSGSMNASLLSIGRADRKAEA